MSATQPQRIVARSPFADAGERPGPGVDLSAVLPQDAAPAPRSQSDRPVGGAWSEPPGPGERTCPQCGRTIGADRRFCRCGAQLTGARAAAEEPEAPPRPPWYRRLGDMVSTDRDFRQAMRAANGGLRVSYDAALAGRAWLVRATLALGAVGILLSQVGPWSPDVRAEVYQRIDRFVPHRYAVIPTDSIVADPAMEPVPGFDLGYAVDGNADRAWAAPWAPPGTGGQPCRRAGGAPALLIAFRRAATVEQVVIRPGLSEGNDKRTLQARPRQVDITFSTGECQSAELTDDAGPQTITVKADDATNARVVIVDAYPPTDKGDGLLSLSEISFRARR